MAETEVWRPVDGAARYEVSNLGRFRRGTVLHSPSRVQSRMGYLRVSFTRDNGTKSTMYLHRLVAETFVEPRSGPWALHRDGNVNNCAAHNLYWGTPGDNALDRIAHGRSGRKGTNPNAKLSDMKVQAIREAYLSGAFTQQDLAEAYGVRQPHISRILRGKNWSFE